MLISRIMSLSARYDDKDLNWYFVDQAGWVLEPRSRLLLQLKLPSFCIWMTSIYELTVGHRSI